MTSFIELETRVSPTRRMSVRIDAISIIYWGMIIEERNEGASILVDNEIYSLTLDSTRRLREALNRLPLGREHLTE